MERPAMQSKRLDSNGEKTFVLVFEPGEEVMAGLLSFANEQRMAGAHFTAIGAFERVTLGFFDPKKKDYNKIPIEEQVELMSLVGNIARDREGAPKIHAHVVVGKSDGTAHGGHLMDAHVRPTLEVVLVESARHLCRTMHPELGAALLDLRN
jgi:predicted DNA-binding protein with PD1-like motif